MRRQASLSSGSEGGQMLQMADPVNYRPMAETSWRQKSIKNAKGPAVYGEPEPIFPEKRLWIAIVVTAINDYVDQLKHIRKLWDADHRPVSRHLHRLLRTTKYEISHKYFGEVCENAGITQDSVVKHLNHLEKEYCLADVRFSLDDSVISRIALRKARKRLQYA